MSQTQSRAWQPWLLQVHSAPWMHGATSPWAAQWIGRTIPWCGMLKRSLHWFSVAKLPAPSFTSMSYGATAGLCARGLGFPRQAQGPDLGILQFGIRTHAPCWCWEASTSVKLSQSFGPLRRILRTGSCCRQHHILALGRTILRPGMMAIGPCLSSVESMRRCSETCTSTIPCRTAGQNLLQRGHHHAHVTVPCGIMLHDQC